MNRDRRNQLSTVADQIDALITSLEVVRDEEQGAYENLPDSLQQSESGRKSEAAIEALDEHIDTITQIADSLREL